MNTDDALWLVESKRHRVNSTIMLDRRIKSLMKKHYYGKMSDVINLKLKEWLEEHGYSVG